jgi:HNH endonuclease
MPNQEWPTWIDWDVWVHDGCRCVYCGLDGTDWRVWFQLQIDHIIPRKAAEIDESLNKVVACFGCNHCKLSYDPRQGETIELTEASRIVLIDRARRYIDAEKEKLRPAYGDMMGKIKSIAA